MHGLSTEYVKQRSESQSEIKVIMCEWIQNAITMMQCMNMNAMYVNLHNGHICKDLRI